ncbi:hypothetical protein INR49_030371 [Caranx melampygus]|nr:hypothetical protein INR49_030371 [Caranx melampygus]
MHRQRLRRTNGDCCSGRLLSSIAIVAVVRLHEELQHFVNTVDMKHSESPRGVPSAKEGL